MRNVKKKKKKKAKQNQFHYPTIRGMNQNNWSGF